jgi:hypothetical protein
VAEPRAMPLVPTVRFAGTVAKRGNTAAECEDHCSFVGRRFAVADGATEASYSHLWAGILTDAFCQAEDRAGESGPTGGWLDAARAEWRLRADELSARELPWFTREALQAGSFASFVGLAFLPQEPSQWMAVSCGDACLFHVHDESVALAIPVRESAGFSNSPVLLASGDVHQPDRLAVVTGTAQPGDAFYLATDALARWFLADYERGGKPWTILDQVTTAGAFEAFVAASRESGALKNDDVALLAIAFGPEP